MSSAVGVRRAARRSTTAYATRSVLISNLALISARVASMGLGFVAWLLAARLFTPSEVGVASALVAAMMLCVQLGLLGIGSAVVRLLPVARQSAGRMIDAGATVVVCTALAVALGFILLAGAVLEELRAVVAPAYALAFAAMAAFGTLNTYYDYVSVALRRGDEVLVRNVAFGAVTIMTLSLSAALGSAASGSLVILVAWALAGLVACSIAAVHVGRAVGRPPSARVDTMLTGRLLRVGWPNWLLTLTERAPALIVPVLIAQVLGPTTNAFWYAAWMMAWVVLIIPISIGQSVYAELSRDPARGRETLLHGLRTSLGLGSAAALALAVGAEVALALLGERYAVESHGALRILVVGVIPVTIIQAYYAASRARGTLAEAVALGVVGGALAVAGVLVAGAIGDLPAMAAAWVAAQVVVAAWAAVRLLQIYRSIDRPEAQPS